MSDQLLSWLIQREELQTEKPAGISRPKPEKPKPEKAEEKPKHTRRKKYESGTIV